MSPDPWREQLEEAAAAAPKFKADESAAVELEQRIAALSPEDWERLSQAVRDASSASMDRKDFARGLFQVVKLGASIGLALA